MYLQMISIKQWLFRTAISIIICTLHFPFASLSCILILLFSFFFIRVGVSYASPLVSQALIVQNSTFLNGSIGISITVFFLCYFITCWLTYSFILFYKAILKELRVNNSVFYGASTYGIRTTQIASVIVDRTNFTSCQFTSLLVTTVQYVTFTSTYMEGPGGFYADSASHIVVNGTTCVNMHYCLRVGILEIIFGNFTNILQNSSFSNAIFCRQLFLWYRFRISRKLEHKFYFCAELCIWSRSLQRRHWIDSIF